MNRKKLIRILGVSVFLLGTFLGDIDIELGEKLSMGSKKYTPKDMNDIQQIRGVFFRSPGESLSKELENFWKTQQNLDLRTYEFTHKDFKNALKALANNNVNVRIIIEDQKFKQYQNTLKVLHQELSWYQNIQLKSDKQMGTEYTHAKVNLIDSGFIIQTANLTQSSFAKNREHFFQSYDTGVRTSLHTIFQKDWNGQKITIKDIHPNLVVCNINCRGVIQYLLKSAQSSIIIQTQYITDDALRTILDQQQNLPEFKLLVADTDDNTDLVKIFGAEKARKLKQYYNHTKMILIDHKILLLGSMNLSATSLDKNREIWILLTDPSILTTFTTQFAQDWTTAGQ